MSKVSIILGSDSDIDICSKAASVLRDFDIPFEERILSAHRTPESLAAYVKEAEQKGVAVFIAIAGMSAALPGAVAAHTTRPVIGVPVAQGSPFMGFDALLSVVQMPPGVPVAAVAVNGGLNAGLLAVSILSVSDPRLAEKLVRYRKKQQENVLEKDARLQSGSGMKQS